MQVGKDNLSVFLEELSFFRRRIFELRLVEEQECGQGSFREQCWLNYKLGVFVLYICLVNRIVFWFFKEFSFFEINSFRRVFGSSYVVFIEVDVENGVILGKVYEKFSRGRLGYRFWVDCSGLYFGFIICFVILCKWVRIWVEFCYL